MRLQGFTGVYMGIHRNTGVYRVYRGLQEYTWVYMRIQGFTGVCMGLHGYIRFYSSDSLGVTIGWETICELP